MANETRDIGAETLTVLSQQSDQLRRVEDRVDSIDDHLTFSERTLRGMESVWGSLKNMMTKPTQVHKPQQEAPPLPGRARVGGDGGRGGGGSMGASGGRGTWDDDSRRGADARQGRGAGGGAGGAGYRASAVDKTFTGQLAAKEREQDECLDQLSSIVGDLKAMGHDVSSELDKQNMMVDRIGDKVQRNDDRIRSTTKRIQKL